MELVMKIHKGLIVFLPVGLLLFPLCLFADQASELEVVGSNAVQPAVQIEWKEEESKSPQELPLPKMERLSEIELNAVKEVVPEGMEKYTKGDLNGIGIYLDAPPKETIDRRYEYSNEKATGVSADAAFSELENSKKGTTADDANGPRREYQFSQDHFFAREMRSGNAYLYEERWDEALSEYMSLYPKNKDDVALNHNLGCVYFAKQQYQDAVEHFIVALRNERYYFNAVIYFDMAVAYQQWTQQSKGELSKGQYQQLLDSAIINFKRAVEIMPFFAQAHAQLALIYADLNQDPKLIELESILSSSHTDWIGFFPPDVLKQVYSYNNFETYLTVAENELAQGRYKQVIEILNELAVLTKTRFPKDQAVFWTIYRTMGYCQYMLGVYDQAAYHLNMSLQMAADQPHADLLYAYLGMISIEKNDFPNAQLELEKALQMNPQNRDAIQALEGLKNKIKSGL